MFSCKWPAATPSSAQVFNRQQSQLRSWDSVVVVVPASLLSCSSHSTDYTLCQHSTSLGNFYGNVQVRAREHVKPFAFDDWCAVCCVMLMLMLLVVPNWVCCAVKLTAASAASCKSGCLSVCAFCISYLKWHVVISLCLLPCLCVLLAEGHTVSQCTV